MDGQAASERSARARVRAPASRADRRTAGRQRAPRADIGRSTSCPKARPCGPGTAQQAPDTQQQLLVSCAKGLDSDLGARAFETCCGPQAHMLRAPQHARHGRRAQAVRQQAGQGPLVAEAAPLPPPLNGQRARVAAATLRRITPACFGACVAAARCACPLVHAPGNAGPAQARPSADHRAHASVCSVPR